MINEMTLALIVIGTLIVCFLIGRYVCITLADRWAEEASADHAASIIDEQEAEILRLRKLLKKVEQKP